MDLLEINKEEKFANEVIKLIEDGEVSTEDMREIYYYADREMLSEKIGFLKGVNFIINQLNKEKLTNKTD